MMLPLTERQAAVLGFIRDRVAEEGRPPTVREIAVRFRIASTFGVRRHLAALERKGYITRQHGSSRGIALTPEFREVSGVPVVGSVAAGTPITAVENLTGYLPVEGLFPHADKLYGLQVQGESMVDEGILDGDYVIVRQKPTFEDGEIGVAIIGEDCTVKKLRRDGDEVRLVPANEGFDETVIDLGRESFRYGGEVVGVLRMR